MRSSGLYGLIQMWLGEADYTCTSVQYLCSLVPRLFCCGFGRNKVSEAATKYLWGGGGLGTRLGKVHVVYLCTRAVTAEEESSLLSTAQITLRVVLFL